MCDLICEADNAEVMSVHGGPKRRALKKRLDADADQLCIRVASMLIPLMSNIEMDVLTTEIDVLPINGPVSYLLL